MVRVEFQTDWTDVRTEMQGPMRSMSVRECKRTMDADNNHSNDEKRARTRRGRSAERNDWMMLMSNSWLV